MQWKRSNIVYIPNDVWLNEGTIYDNLHSVNFHAPDADIDNALMISCCIDFIKDLPDGINTKVIDGGNNLSTGQRQRILIAQSILRNPKILLFDEATSALDESTQNRIIENIKYWGKNKIIVFAAHRLNVIKTFKSILVLSDGVIVAKGNHENLLSQCKIYSKMWFKEAKENITYNVAQ